MKKAINAWSVAPSVGFEAMFQAIKAAGFDGIELNVDAPDHSAHSLTMQTDTPTLSQIRALSARYALPVVSISTSLSDGKMGTGAAQDRAFAISLIQKQVEFARALGATGILTVPGGIGETVSIQAAYDNAHAALRALRAAFDPGDIRIGLENVWNGFFASPFDMARFVDALDSPCFTAYYDVGNVVAFSWSEYWIEILGRRISHVHIKDFKRSRSLHSGGAFVDLLKGDVNWPKVMPALRAAGFDGYLTAEVFKEKETEDEQAFYESVSHAMDQILTLQGGPGT